MKFFLVLIITIVTSFNSFSNCLDTYDQVKTKTAVKGALSTTGTAGATYIGVLFGVVGLSVINSPGSNLLQGISTIAVGATPPGFLAFSSVNQALEYISVSKVYDLIEEAEVSMGEQLTDTAEELSERLERTVLESDIAPLISKANQNKVFCASESAPYNYKNIINYLLKELE